MRHARIVVAFGLQAVHIAIATAIHASIVLLASRSRLLLVSGHHQKPVPRILAVTLVLVAAWLAWSTRRA
jgi:threonine/homoserine/homoserine lactone efflux protein